MPTHVQELRIISSGEPAYIVYDAPAEPHRMAVIVGIYDSELPVEYRDLARLPVAPTRAIDIDMFRTLATIMPRFSPAWREPTHFQVFRSPMRSNLGPRRVTVFWSFEGDPPVIETSNTEEIKTLDHWIGPYENGAIVAMVEGYLVDPEGLSRMESRWTNAAGFNALLAARPAFDANQGDERSSYLRTMQFSERRPKAEPSPAVQRAAQPAVAPAADEKPKVRRGKWKRTPKTPAGE